MKYYAVIDTNVLVSAMLKRDSVPGNIMELVFTGCIVPVVNEEIVTEYREVLKRPKFHFTDGVICDVVENIERRAVYIDINATFKANPYLERALMTGITGLPFAERKC